MATMNGQPFFTAKNGGAIYVPLPRDVATPIDGGCGCSFCKAHPDITPAWDTVVIPLNEPHRCGVDGCERTWTTTVHFPELAHAAQTPDWLVRGNLPRR